MMINEPKLRIKSGKMIFLENLVNTNTKHMNLSMIRTTITEKGDFRNTLSPIKDVSFCNLQLAWRKVSVQKTGKTTWSVGQRNREM